MSTSSLLLQSPLQFANGKTAKNRITLAPMTNCQSQQDGTLGQDEFDWLECNAKGGFSMILTCASYVMKSAQAWPGQLGIYDDHLLPGLTSLATMLRRHGALGIVQLFHGGVRCPTKLTGQQPVSASEFEFPVANFEKPRALSVAEIKDIVQHFALAAKRAYEAGFDGVELHGANGYLITQFISTQTNLRTDEYGGSVENRARFVREILRACRNLVPKNFLIGVRLSPENMQTGLDIDDTLQIAEWLVQDGADFIDLSQMNGQVSSQKYGNDNTTPVITLFRQRLGSDYPIIAGGQIGTPSDAEKIIELGATMVYLGRVAIGNTDWPKLALAQEIYLPTLPPFLPDYLETQGRSQTFIDYCKNLPMGVVA